MLLSITVTGQAQDVECEDCLRGLTKGLLGQKHAVLKAANAIMKVQPAHCAQPCGLHLTFYLASYLYFF